MGYENWESKRLSPLRIQLDHENPRLPGLQEGATQEKIRSELFDTSKVREMIKSIANSGFFPDQGVVVIKKDSGRGYIVVEGNRRVCACQALLNPKLSPEKHLRVVNRWSEVADQYRDSFAKIPVVVAPSRIAAIRLMASRHLNDAPVLSWSRYAQGRFAISAVEKGQSMGDVVYETGLSESDVKKSIQEARLHDLFFGLDWSEDERGIILNNFEKFPIEVISRILRSSKTHEAFGKVVFDDDGWPVFYWEKDSVDTFLKRILYDAHPALVQDQNRRLNSRNLNSKDDVARYLDNLPNEIKPKKSSEGVSAREFVAEDEEEVIKKPTQPMSSTGAKPEKKAVRKKREAALPDDIEVAIKNDKVKGIVEELQSTLPESSPYATGLLLRTLLEISLIARVREAGQWKDCIGKYQKGKYDLPSLDNVLKFSADNDLVITDISLRKSLSNQFVVPRILLNLVAHNDTHIFTGNDARDASKKMLPLLRHLLARYDQPKDIATS